MNKTLKNMTVFVLLVLMVLYSYSLLLPQSQEVKLLDYSTFMGQVENGAIKTADIVADSDGGRYQVSGTMRDKSKYVVVVPPDPQFAQFLESKNIKVQYDVEPPPPWWVTLFSTLLPTLLIIAFFFLFMQQSQGGGGKVMQFGKSRAKLSTDDKKKVTFDDVAGVDEAKEELAEVVEFLKNPRKFSAIGAKIPKGVLLYGPPGTGKTLLAKAVAGEAGVPFFTISGSDFVEMFVGVGASRVRDLFEQSKKQAPCIIFIDEIDAVGRQRGAGLGGGHDEREQTLNQLLVEMDGFSANEGIIVIAATNRPDILDPALLRPGRFDRQITVDLPDVIGRLQILKVHAKGKPLEAGVDLDVLARRTPGFTGADLANTLNEAALLAARQGNNKISMKNLEDAIERVIAGPEKKSRAINEREKKLVSYHEAGHAVVSYYLPNADPLHKISIIPRGRAGGYTLLLPKEDRKFITKSYLEDQLCTFLGGRIAEEIILKDVSTGAQNDLERATETIRSMITQYGMSEELGPLTFGKDNSQVFLGKEISHERNYSDAIAYAIDKEARRMIDEAHSRTTTILTEHIDKLHKVAQALMEKETIEADEFYAIMEDRIPEMPQEADALAEQPEQAEKTTASAGEEPTWDLFDQEDARPKVSIDFAEEQPKKPETEIE